MPNDIPHVRVLKLNDQAIDEDRESILDECELQSQQNSLSPVESKHLGSESELEGKRN